MKWMQQQNRNKAQRVMTRSNGASVFDIDKKFGNSPFYSSINIGNPEKESEIQRTIYENIFQDKPENDLEKQNILVEKSAAEQSNESATLESSHQKTWIPKSHEMFKKSGDIEIIENIEANFSSENDLLALARFIYTDTPKFEDIRNNKLDALKEIRQEVVNNKKQDTVFSTIVSLLRESGLNVSNMVDFISSHPDFGATLTTHERNHLDEILGELSNS